MYGQKFKEIVPLWNAVLTRWIWQIVRVDEWTGPFILSLYGSKWLVQFDESYGSITFIKWLNSTNFASRTGRTYLTALGTTLFSKEKSLITCINSKNTSILNISTLTWIIYWLKVHTWERHSQQHFLLRIKYNQ